MTRTSSCIDGLDGASQRMVQSFVVMFLASVAVGFLSWLGLVLRRECCDGGEYSWCAAAQDLRSLFSVVAGGIVCHLGQRCSPRQEEEDQEVACCGGFASLLW
uniref:Uncharacterized protein n=1 Tax=Alexandrium catenella TaxID=2925 RepID=A0A7S1S0Q6_ALECA|mmetsp:Transcript_78925/g.209603  ORF Transcript_78925/g.209603 Transcript_78925/m.209603 type:complete len:103 (+) Transcript_78925:67-375(+)